MQSLATDEPVCLTSAPRGVLVDITNVVVVPGAGRASSGAKTEVTATAEEGKKENAKNQGKRRGTCSSRTRAVKHTTSISLHPFVYECQEGKDGKGEAAGGAEGTMEVERDCLDLETVLDIDALDRDDPTCCWEYVEDIYGYLREKEVRERVDSEYMKRQSGGMTEWTRAGVVDCMAELTVRFKLNSETFFMGVSMMDKFLERKVVVPSKVQLLGVSALLLAMKMEEMYPVEIRELVKVGKSSYDRRAVVECERDIVTTLDWKLLAPSSMNFLRRFSKAAQSDGRTHTLSKYLVEFAAQEYECLKFLPSLIAAGSVYLARFMLGIKPLWTSTMQYYLRYDPKEVLTCSRELQRLLKSPTNPNLKTLRRKYSTAKFLTVSKIPPGPDL